MLQIFCGKLRISAKKYDMYFIEEKSQKDTQIQILAQEIHNP